MTLHHHSRTWFSGAIACLAGLGILGILAAQAAAQCYIILAALYDCCGASKIVYPCSIKTSPPAADEGTWVHWNCPERTNGPMVVDVVLGAPPDVKGQQNYASALLGHCIIEFPSCGALPNICTYDPKDTISFDCVTSTLTGEKCVG